MIRLGPLAVVLGAAMATAGCSQPVATGPRPAARGEAAPALLQPGPNEITAVEWRSEKWRFGGTDGAVIITPHHRLYTTVTDRYLLERLPLFLERSLAHYGSALGPLPAPRGTLETFLFATRSEWESKTRQMLPNQAGDFLALGRGGFTTRGVSVLYDIGRRDTLAIAAHEGWHQYTQRTFENPLPVWLEEGLATYMEGYRTYPDGIAKFSPWTNMERYQALRMGVRRNALIPLMDVLSQRPESFLKQGKYHLLVYYAQVWALVHFLAEGEDGRYRDALEQVLHEAATGGSARFRRAASGRVGPTVIQEYFLQDLEAFEAQYDEFVESITRSGGRDQIMRGRSPL